eukprot:05341.XXX_161386_160841_1 [CDS] Oithona nana genome sequencing.
MSVIDQLKSSSLQKADGTNAPTDCLNGKSVVLIYFSAHWCPPCRAFTPMLKDFYEEVEGEGVEIIFVSSDRSPQDMANYMKESHGNWLAMPHGSEVGQELKKKFGVSGIPCLVVLKGADGTLITKEGRNAVQAKGPAAVKEWK